MFITFKLYIVYSCNTIILYYIILQSLLQSVTLGRPGEILNMFRNKHLKKKKKKKYILIIKANIHSAQYML